MPYQNKGFQGAPGRPRVVPEGGARLVSIAESLGRRLSFTSTAVVGGGIKTRYVSIYLPGNSCVGRKKVGRLDQLAAMTDEEVQATMVAAFAPKGMPQ